MKNLGFECLVFGALAVLLMCSRAHAQLGPTEIALSLNLRYTDPRHPNQGGTWAILAKTGSLDGISEVNAWLSGVDSLAIPGNGGVLSRYYPQAIDATTIGTIEQSPGSLFAGEANGLVNVLYRQNTTVAENSSIVLDVGGGAGTPGNIARDPLGHPSWDNSALLATGTFGAQRPTWGTSGLTMTGGSVLPVGATSTSFNVPSIPATVTTIVRGDSTRSLGLESPAGAGLWFGDVSRNLRSDNEDLALVYVNWITGSAGMPGHSWDDGDVTGDGTVGPADFTGVLQYYNVTGAGYLPPGAGAPVPATASRTPGTTPYGSGVGGGSEVRYRLSIDGNSSDQQQLSPGRHTLKVEVAVSNNEISPGQAGGTLLTSYDLSNDSRAIVFNESVGFLGHPSGLWQRQTPFLGNVGTLAEGKSSVVQELNYVTRSNWESQYALIGAGQYTTLTTGDFFYDGRSTVLSLSTSTALNVVAAREQGSIRGVFAGMTFGDQIAISVKPSADFDGDGDIDGADFLCWQAHVGQTSAAHSNGDADYDGDVDADDLSAWKSAYAAASGTLTPVPEPGAALLIVVGMGALRAKRRRDVALKGAVLGRI